MNTVDQRILIPTSPDVVWQYISDIRNNPKWQFNCQAVSLLTNAGDGRGMRWRHSTQQGRDYIIEITAWYDRVGYEYVILDGAPYKENQGRIRLQEIPEGTIVQWTFNYDLGGMLGGLRNAMTTRRSVENTIVESLWALWRNTSTMREENYTAKSLMREAPDVEERSQYKPRHPSVMRDGGAVSLDFNEPISIDSAFAPPSEPASIPPVQLPIAEPPIAEDDTRPRPGVSTVETPQPQTGLGEPDFLNEIREQPPAADDYRLAATSTDQYPRVETTRFEDSEVPFDGDSAFAPPKNHDFEFDTQNQVAQPPNPPYDSANPSETEAEGDETPLYDPIWLGEQDTEQSTEPAARAVDPAEFDTGKVSVFDLFGVPKPSETQEIQKVTETATPAPIDEVPPPTPAPIPTAPLETPDETIEQTKVVQTASAEATPAPGEPPKRTGLRVHLRQKRLNIRLPK